MGDLLNNPDIQALLSELAKLLPDIIKAVGTALIIIGIIAVVLLIIDYILRSVAVAKVGHRRGIPLWGFAWIPGLRLITIGAIADDHDKKTIRRRHGFRILLPVLFLIFLVAVIVDYVLLKASVASFIKAVTADPNNILQALSSCSGGKTRSIMRIIACLSGSLLTVFNNIAIYKYIESCKKTHTFADMILYLIVPFAAPIVLLAVSGSDSDKVRKKKRLPPPEEEYVVEEAEYPEEE